MDDVDRRLLRDELNSQFRDQTRSLSSHLSGMHSAVSRLDDGLGRQIRAVADDQKSLAADIADIRRELSGFAERTGRDLAALKALANLVNVRAELDRRYGRYDRVRARARGLVEAIDNDLAEDATTTLFAEELSIEAPDYWLASMANASAAWLRDEPKNTERALRRAITQNPGRSALYAGLLNARYRRLDCTYEWLDTYLRSLNVEELPADFVVVLDAAVVGVLGVKTREKVNNWCNAGFQLFQPGSPQEKAQVSRWSGVVKSYADRGAPDTAFATAYPVLAEISPPGEARKAAEGFRVARSFGEMAEQLRIRAAAPGRGSPDWRQRIDGLLERLRQLPEPGEETLRDAARDYERVVGLSGDEVQAEKLRQNDLPLNMPTVDLLTLFTNIALKPGRYQVSGATAQLAKYLSIGPLTQAVHNLESTGRDHALEPIAVTIANWSGGLRPGVADEAQLTEFTAALDGWTRRAETREKRTDLLIGAGMIAFAGLLGYGAALFSGRPTTSAFALGPLVIALVAAVGFLTLRLRAPGRIRQASEEGEARKQQALAKMEQARTERNLLYDRWSARLDDVTALVDRIQAAEQPILISDPAALEQEQKLIEAAYAELLAKAGDQVPRLPRWSLSLFTR